MKFPAHFGLELNEQDRADLTATRQRFIASMNGLDEAQQLTRARVIAGGLREGVDAYTRAMAQQVVDAANTQTEIETAQRELKAIEADLRNGGYRPKDPHWRGAALERQESLKASIEQAHARLIGIAEETFGTAQKKAAVGFREAREAARKTAELKEAVAQAEARFEAEDVQRRAEAIAKGRRMAAGKSGRPAGESQ